jgi:predicted dienelactone hydrolase
MTRPTPPPKPSPFDLATTFCSNIYFHQSIHLPASTEHDRLRVTFATTTNFDDQQLPVVLFCHPMGAARYLIYMFEAVAKREGVRVLIIDRCVIV